MTARTSLGALAYACAVAACGAPAQGGDTTIGNHVAQPEDAGGAHAVDWLNHTYPMGELGDIAVTGGTAEFGVSSDFKAVPSGAPDSERGELRVAPPVFADVDGDGRDDAVVTTYLRTGGTGNFSSITVYAVRRAGSKPVVLGEIEGGDRGDGGIDSVAADGPTIVVTRLKGQPGDGACCPSQAQIERWSWHHGKLVEDTSARKLVPHER